MFVCERERESMCVCVRVCLRAVCVYVSRLLPFSGDFNQEKESISDTDREGGYRCSQKKGRILIFGERNDFPLRLYDVFIIILCQMLAAPSLIYSSCILSPQEGDNSICCLSSNLHCPRSRHCCCCCQTAAAAAAAAAAEAAAMRSADK